MCVYLYSYVFIYSLWWFIHRLDIIFYVLGSLILILSRCVTQLVVQVKQFPGYILPYVGKYWEPINLSVPGKEIHLRLCTSVRLLPFCNFSSENLPNDNPPGSCTDAAKPKRLKLKKESDQSGYKTANRVMTKGWIIIYWRL